MTDDTTMTEAPTRREYLKYGGVVVGGGLLAGCMGNSGGDPQGDSDSNSTDGSTPTTGTARTTRANETANSAETTPSETNNPTRRTASDSGSYSVRMAPMGEVTFEEVPEKWIAGTGDWADMGVALGLEAPGALWLPERFNSYHYDELPGVSVDKSSITALYSDGVDKEVFYELDADVHVFDPNFLANRFQWEQADIDELRANVAPYFGNTIFSREYPWHDYRYYSLYDAFGKLAEAFQRRERYRELESVHEQLVGDVQSRLPPENQRPSVVVMYPQPIEQPESFLPYPLGKGTTFAHMNTLGLRGAFGTDVNSFTNDRGEIDYETLLEIDPDVLLLQGNEAKSAEEFRGSVVRYLKNQDVASQLTAVENGDVYRAGGLYQGPIINLFLIERLGGNLYPERFGSETLFDRQQVADIINGEI